MDNVFFKSEVLKWGNPSEARNDPQFENNFLIEKPHTPFLITAAKTPLIG
jgi:hypothetical protein